MRRDQICFGKEKIVPLCSRSALLSVLVLVGFAPALGSAAPVYQIGASLDLQAIDIPLSEVTGGYISPPDSDGAMHWWLGASSTNPYSIDVAGVELGQITRWTADLKEDPYVTNNINITNNTAFNIVYVATVSMPIPAFAYDTIVNSSVGVTATDSDAFNDMLVDLDGTVPFYQGRVNAVTILSLTPPAVPITTADCPFPGPGCTATSAVGVASQAVAPGVATNIEIILRFVLSPGDSVGITSRFEIVPEPTTGLLLGLGLVGLAVARRNKSR
jgi:hypothetical protein